MMTAWRLAKAYFRCRAAVCGYVFVISPTPSANRATIGLSALSRTDPDVAQKYRDLRRMRVFATSLPAFMTLVFVATSLSISSWPALACVRAFAEAAMVGACADCRRRRLVSPPAGSADPA
jgi:hypothetical protein